MNCNPNKYRDIEELFRLRSRKPLTNIPQYIEAMKTLHMLYLEGTSYIDAMAVIRKKHRIHEDKIRMNLAYQLLLADNVIKYDANFQKLFRKKLNKSSSGVVNVTIASRPGAVPHWEIITCTHNNDSIHVYVAKTSQSITSYINQTDPMVPMIIKDNQTYVITHHTSDTLTATLIESKNDIKPILELDDMLRGCTTTKSCVFKCVFCPTEKDDKGDEINPKSYLSGEPAVARAIESNYDVVEQMRSRLHQLLMMGHDISKVMARHIGGTWGVLSSAYQKEFCRDIFYASNTILDMNLREPLSLEEEQKINEGAFSRIVELSIEDHPKMLTVDRLKFFRELGITAIEFGMQTTNDKILSIIKRDCTRDIMIKKMRLLKFFGFKTLAHIMPDLPGSTYEGDLDMIKDVMRGHTIEENYYFVWIALGYLVLLCKGNPIVACLCIMLGVYMWFNPIRMMLFDPDRLKLYPCMVLDHSELKEWWQDNRYQSYFDKNKELLYDVMEKFMCMAEEHQRIERVVRDVPASKDPNKMNYVNAGIDETNGQQITLQRMAQKNLKCKCMRCREIKDNPSDISKARLKIKKYRACGGTEYFISMCTHDNEYIYGFLKLRINDYDSEITPKLPKELEGASLIRWLQVFGGVVSFNGGASSCNQVQHVGFGRRMMMEAERITKSHGLKRIADISGVGVRDYYRKLGYKLKHTYMCKELNL
uniref:tRNA carboxymethyluridine synthase n=1 Tax=Megaviridae environmental sample TaxID=1737588 RepID=A0A5J6VKQ8_9VIRU|nr:MAG: hypothetical protein [Megaviridae environmental sample]